MFVIAFLWIYLAFLKECRPLQSKFASIACASNAFFFLMYPPSTSNENHQEANITPKTDQVVSGCVSVQQCKENEKLKNLSQHEDNTIAQFRRPNRVSRQYKCFGPRDKLSSSTNETSSCPIIDDRSNSASPTRRQPHPAGMHALRGFGFGQPTGNDERVLEWPPPEPRPLFRRHVVQPIGLMFGTGPRPPHNPNVWFFGPTANVQQVIFEDGPEIIEMDEEEDIDDEDNVVDDEESAQPVFEEQESTTPHPTASEVSNGAVHQPDYDTLTPIPSQQEATTAMAVASRRQQHAIDEYYSEQAPGVSMTTSNEDVHGAVQVQQANVEPPPRPVFFVIVDTNEGGTPDDEQQAAQFNFALLQLLAQLESGDDDYDGNEEDL